MPAAREEIRNCRRAVTKQQKNQADAWFFALPLSSQVLKKYIRKLIIFSARDPGSSSVLASLRAL